MRPPPLDGLRVLELSSGIAGAAAGMWLACAGADVIKVEPGEGDPSRRASPTFGDGPDAVSPLFLYLNAGKRSISALELTLSGLAEEADAVITDEGVAVSARDFPGARAILDFSLCGSSGPRSHWQGGSFLAGAYGGWMSVCGDPGRPPLRMGGAVAEHLAGIYGYMAALVDLLQPRREGGPRRIEVALSDVVAGNLEYSCLIYSFLGAVRRRWFSRQPHFYPLDLYRCKDGWVHLVMSYPAPPGSGALLIDRPELVDHPLMLDNWQRIAGPEAFDALVQPYFSAHTRYEIAEKAHELRMPVAVMNTMLQLLEDPQLAARSFFHLVDHPQVGKVAHPGCPWRVDGERAWSVGPAPEPGSGASGWRGAPRQRPALAGATPTKPLRGLTVVDMTYVYGGPTAGRILADLGAEVLKIESGVRPDGVRVLVLPENDPSGDYWNRGGYFLARNLGKKSVTLDVHKEEGRALLRRLIAQADVLLEAFTPRVMESLGLTYESLEPDNPRLIMVSMSGYGKGGPHSDWTAFGMGLESAAGVNSLTGYGPGEERRTGISLNDPVSGIVAAAAVLTALYERQETGRGCAIDLAQRDAAIPLIGEFLLEAAITGKDPQPVGNSHPDYALHGVFRCKGDDNWLVIEAREDYRLEVIQDVTGVPQDGLEDWLQGQDAWEVADRLQRAGVPAAPVQSARDVLLDPHFRERGIFEVVDHEGVGPRPLPRQFPVRFDGEQVGSSGRAPRLGEHTSDVLRGRFGLGTDELERLQRDGVTAEQPDVIVPEEGRYLLTFHVEALVRHGAFVMEPDYKKRLGLE